MNDQRKGARILILEAAGARGLSPLTMLGEITNRVQEEQGLDEPPNPDECFEFMIGVDTAALIVALIGRLGLSIEKATEYFKTLGREVFTDKKAMSMITGSTDYKTTKLKQVLKDMMKEVTGSENTPMMDSSPDPKCRTMIFAMSKHNMNAGIPTIFRSYRAYANSTPDCAIWEAICASTAHPGHFKSIDIGQPPAHESFVAGAFGCSNPIIYALEEIKRICPDEHVATIVCLGAGHPRTIHIPEPNPLQRIMPADVSMVTMNIVIDSERVAREIAVRFQATTDVYFRLSVEQGMQEVEMDDWSKLGKTLAHTRAYMRRSEVNTMIDRAVKAIGARKPTIPTAQIDGQITMLSAQKATGVKQCPDPTLVFTGQEQKIERVKKNIINGDKGRCVFVLHGLGGSGKTQIALKTIQETRDVWTDIVYVDATSRETTISTLEGFAKARQIGDTKEDTIQWLSTHEERWLMVFDNADDPSLGVNSFFPTGNHGSILITTRIPHLALLGQGSDSDFSISGMDAGDAIELLLKTARVPGESMLEAEHDAAETLLWEVGYLALAIVHAGAYIFCSKCTFSQYFDMFFRHRQATLERYGSLLVDIDNYGRSIYTTWHMSYQRLGPQAQQTLWLMAYMHHDTITEELFRRAAANIQTYKPEIPASKTEEKVEVYIKKYLATFLDSTSAWGSGAFLGVMTELMSYSLISYDGVNGVYNLHVLVHDWASTVIPHTTAVAIEHTAFFLAVSIDYEKSLEDIGFKRSLEMHVNEVLGQQAERVANQAALFAEVYSCAGRWKRKEALEVVVLDARKRALGEEHPYTLISMSNLAGTYHRLGKYEQAEVLQLHELELCKRIHGSEHPCTVTGMNNLALMYQGLGQFERAEALQVQGLELCKRIQGNEHPRTLTSMNNLALTYQKLGQYERAEALQVQVLGLRKRVLGNGHPDTLTSMSNLALTYNCMGRYERAEVFNVLELESCEQFQGNEHPDTLTSMNNLAATYHQLGKYKQAEELQARVLEIRKRILGNGHPHTLTSMSNLSVIYQRQGQYTQAKVLQVQVLKIRKRVLGDEHPETLASMSNLSVTYQGLGLYGRAEVLQLQLLEIRKRVLGYEHPDTLSSMNNLAVGYQDLGQYEQAEALQVQIIELCKRVQDDEHPYTLTSMSNLALIYRCLGQYERSEALQVQVLAVRQRALGPRHPETLSTMQHLLILYQDMGQPRRDQHQELMVQIADLQN